jgi:serine/threonine-protein kinase
VKILHRDLRADSESAARFRHEAEITATIRHPHVVQVFDFNITEGGVPFLVMELVEGELLSGRLACVGSLGPGPAVAILEQIAYALSAAHERGIVHRDLKPDNVMLVETYGVHDFVKLLDFGISQASWRPGMTEPNVISGTPEYMAPEQAAADEARIGPRTDQWALAAIAYEVLTGLEPFQGESPLAVLDKVINAKPIVPSDLAPTLTDGVDAVILRGLSKEPGDRYPDVVAFCSALRDALQLKSNDAGRTGQGRQSRAKAAVRTSLEPRRTVRLLRRMRWRKALLSAAMALSVLLASVLWARSAPAGRPAGAAFISWTRATIHFVADHLGGSRR